jgi:hypothetical protein
MRISARGAPCCAPIRTYAPMRNYPRALVTLNQKLFRFWHYELVVMCTHCGFDRFPAARRGLSRLSVLSNALYRLLPIRPRDTRILTLFEKHRS